MAQVLIIDDDPLICEMLTAKLGKMGCSADSAHTLSHGLDRAVCEDYDVVYLDVRMPDGNGLELVEKIRNTETRPEVIIITGMGDPEGAEKAINSGAWDYIEKGSSIKDMILPLMRALQYREEKQSTGVARALKRDNIIGSSEKMKHCFDLLAQASGSLANVLITGQTGTGKELFAMAIHDNSKVADNSFVVVDCAALPETLVESILLGHEKGAFTGADRPREGLVSQANGGTLFLDEVGELPMTMQKAFLRVLQEKRFRPIGSKHEVSSNFRLVAATNRDLDKMAAEGRFRQDLLYRLRSLIIELPPLNERQSDIEELTIHYLTRLSQRWGVENKGFTPDFLETLGHYGWPGNVRELFNVLEQAMTAAGPSPTIFAKHLPASIRIAKAVDSMSRAAPATARPVSVDPVEPLADLPDHDHGLMDFGNEIEGIRPLADVLERAMNQVEETYLRNLMDNVGWDIKKACSISELSRTSLYNRLKKYGVSRKS